MEISDFKKWLKEERDNAKAKTTMHSIAPRDDLPGVVLIFHSEERELALKQVIDKMEQMGL